MGNPPKVLALVLMLGVPLLDAAPEDRPKRLLHYESFPVGPRGHFTPFLESNALPGSFRPLHGPPRDPPALYDHLAGLKLAHRQHHTSVETFTAPTVDVPPPPPPRRPYVVVNLPQRYEEPRPQPQKVYIVVPRQRRPPDPVQFVPPPTEPPAEKSPNNVLSKILRQLQESDALPDTLTADNIDNSIRTLVRILEALKKRREPPPRPAAVAEEGDREEGGTPGRPGVDYPTLRTIPPTAFRCDAQRYKGFFGDPATGCQVWHYCDLNGGQASFLCPNGTVFSQVALTCDWWYNVNCDATTAQQYVLNERLYKYIIPLSPKFPEDYSGPLVDKYLATKFREMEEELRRQKAKGKKEQSEEDEDEDDEGGAETEANTESGAEK